VNWISTARSGRGILECTGATTEFLFTPMATTLTEGRCGAGGAAPRRNVKKMTTTGYGPSAQEM